MQVYEQKGLTLIGWVLVLFFVGTFIWSAIVMTTIHLERLKIKSALETLQTFSFITKESEDKIRTRIMNKLSIDYLETERREYYKDRFKINKNDGALSVSIDYEIRKPLFWSFDLIGKYSDSVKIVIQ